VGITVAVSHSLGPKFHFILNRLKKYVCSLIPTKKIHDEDSKTYTSVRPFVSRNFYRPTAAMCPNSEASRSLMPAADSLSGASFDFSAESSQRGHFQWISWRRVNSSTRVSSTGILSTFVDGSHASFLGFRWNANISMYWIGLGWVWNVSYYPMLAVRVVSIG
jgi:hypothetical protein